MWCDILTLRNTSSDEFKRIIICTSEEIKYLIEDAIELAYRRRGFEVVKTETVGRVDDVITVKKEE